MLVLNIYVGSLTLFSTNHRIVYTVTHQVPKVWTQHYFVPVPVLDFQKKIVGPAGPQVFIFCRQNKYSGRQKLYLRINGFSFLKDNGLSLVYVFPKKIVTYLGGQVSDQVWKFRRHCVKAGRIDDATSHNVEPWVPSYM